MEILGKKNLSSTVLLYVRIRAITNILFPSISSSTPMAPFHISPFIPFGHPHAILPPVKEEIRIEITHTQKEKAEEKGVPRSSSSHASMCASSNAGYGRGEDQTVA